MRLSFPGANFYRHSLQLIHHAESRLVGQIIADKNRFATGKRRFLHEGSDRLPFVDTAGFNLHHALAKLQRQQRVALNNALRQLQHRGLLLRGLTVVQREGHLFTLQLTPGERLQRRGQLSRDFIAQGRRQRDNIGFAIDITALGPVNAGQR